jgi:hypothetical protein
MRNLFLLIPLGCLALGIAAHDNSLPPKKLVDRLEKQIQTRFLDTSQGRFGISRLFGPYSSHPTLYSPNRDRGRMVPENDEETAILGSLKAAGWDAVAFTASEHRTYHAHDDPVTHAVIYEPGFTVDANVHGPVLIAGQYREDFRAGMPEPELDAAAKKAIDSGKENVEFDYQTWRFVAQRVHAQQQCLSCHRQRYPKMKVGDMIGIYMVGFRKLK